jgi:Uma2 family endonuclease
MNMPFRLPPAESYRHRFTGDEVLQLIEYGMLPDNQVELIDGDIVHMASEGERHIDVKGALNEFLATRLQGVARLACDSTLHLTDHNWPSPDFYIVPLSMRRSQAHGPDTLLVIEISDTSRRKDSKIKAPLYKRCGVREYWLVDIDKGETMVHRADIADGWPIEPAIPFDQYLSPSALPDLRVRMADHMP